MFKQLSKKVVSDVFRKKFRKNRMMFLFFAFTLLVTISGCDKRYEFKESEAGAVYLFDKYFGEMYVIDGLFMDKIEQKNSPRRYPLELTVDSTVTGTLIKIAGRVNEMEDLVFYTVDVFIDGKNPDDFKKLKDNITKGDGLDIQFLSNAGNHVLYSHFLNLKSHHGKTTSVDEKGDGVKYSFSGKIHIPRTIVENIYTLKIGWRLSEPLTDMFLINQSPPTLPADVVPG